MKTAIRLFTMYCLILIATEAYAGVLKVLTNVDTTTKVAELNKISEHLAVTNDGNTLRLEYSGEEPFSVTLEEVLLKDLDNRVLTYSADIQSEGVQNQAYLEMYCVLEGKHYFSRDLNDVFTGSMDWREVSTPFFLKNGQFAEKVLLGVRFEGPGSLWIKEMKLVDGPNNQFYIWAWLPGTLLGVIGGTLGSITNTMASKGKNRSLATGIMYALIAVVIVLLILGIVFYVQGQSYHLWYGFLLPGVIGVLVFPSAYISQQKQYEQFELKRMKRMDLADSIE